MSPEERAELRDMAAQGVGLGLSTALIEIEKITLLLDALDAAEAERDRATQAVNDYVRDATTPGGASELAAKLARVRAAAETCDALASGSWGHYDESADHAYRGAAQAYDHAEQMILAALDGADS